MRIILFFIQIARTVHIVQNIFLTGNTKSHIFIWFKVSIWWVGRIDNRTLWKPCNKGCLRHSQVCGWFSKNPLGCFFYSRNILPLIVPTKRRDIQVGRQDIFFAHISFKSQGGYNLISLSGKCRCIPHQLLFDQLLGQRRSPTWRTQANRTKRCTKNSLWHNSVMTFKSFILCSNNRMFHIVWDGCALHRYTQ